MKVQQYKWVYMKQLSSSNLQSVVTLADYLENCKNTDT